MTDDRYRLPRDVRPRAYHLSIAPDLGSSTFTGTAVIDVDVATPTEEIVCNAAGLTIERALFATGDGPDAEVEASTDGELERVTLRLADKAVTGPARVTFHYSGVLGSKLAGFYRSTFKDDDGAERVIGATQFEATDARRAFPCWDEPDAKASFDIELLVPAGLVAISNSAEASERPGPDGGRWVRFAPTMPMSTYLVAWVVGPLEVTQAVDVDGVPLRVACVPGRRHLASFALEVGAHALRFFASYFGIDYPAGKLDLVALPDFAFGAMENLGCVTFRESALLIDPARASRQELERIADVVSHEIAHMWFGDLVTMKWWNGIWLNEAFATFMEVLAVDAFRPDWERWTTFSASRAGAMMVDGLASTRPVEYPVVSPDDAEGMFDTLTYEKGGAVLRMLEQYLGASRFRDGIRQYLDRHRYGNTETTDLWDALEEATGEPVRALMDTWILQPGLPEVSVSAANGLTLQQRRFRFRPDPSDADVRWHVPVLLRDGGRVLVTAGTQTVPAGDDVMVNAGGWGFFVTRYAPELLERVLDGLSGLGAIERFNIVNDTWAAAVAGSSSVLEFVSVARRVAPQESDPTVWEAILGPLDLLHRIATANDRPRVAELAEALCAPAFARVGWDPTPGESPRIGTVRAELVEALGTIAEDAEVQQRCASLHASYLSDAGSVAPDLLAPVVRVLAWSGGPSEYEAFVGRWRSPATPQEELRYLYALPAFRQPELLERTLALAASEIRTQNGPYVIRGALANRWLGPRAWAWLTPRWDALMDRFPSNSISRMLEGITALIEPSVADEVLAFMGAHPVPQAQLVVNQLLERLQINTLFAERESPSLPQVLALPD